MGRRVLIKEDKNKIRGPAHPFYYLLSFIKITKDLIVSISLIAILATIEMIMQTFKVMILDFSY